MTGTAQTEAAEFKKVYKVGVVSIPTHRPMIRDDQPDVIYKTEKAKFNAVVEDIVERHQQGQPVLVGTVSVENSEILSQMLRRRGIPHAVLNAKYHAKEAEIIAQAGRRGAVTVATNMAGRGTDILLGGNPEFLAAAELRNRGLDPGGARRRSTRPPWSDAHPAVEEAVRRGGRGGRRGRRPVRARHRAARPAAHRQPAARPVGPAGRPGRVPVLPVAAGRADAAVPGRRGRGGHGPAEHPRGRADRVQDRHAGRSRARRRRSRRRTPRSARTSSSTTRCSTSSARSSTPSGAGCWTARTCTTRSRT